MAALTLKDDLLETARQYAATQALSLDEAVARLIGLGLEYASGGDRAMPPRMAESPAVRFVDGFGEFAAPPDTPVLSTEDLLRIENEY
jgi:hypothetical protein